MDQVQNHLDPLVVGNTPNAIAVRTLDFSIATTVLLHFQVG
jgi:hypothetical protein